MSDSFSSIGFGYQPFGHFPFGWSDWAEEVLWKTLPRFIRDEDEVSRGDVDNVVRGWINAIKPSFNDLRFKWADFTSLWNADTIPLEQLPLLAYNVGMIVFEDKPEQLQRSSVLNAPQLYIHKGTDKGYQIIAAFEGLTVEITPLWAETCLPDAPLTDQPPDAFIAEFDSVPADEIHLDTVYDDHLAIWPFPLYSVWNPSNIFFDDIPLDAIPLDSGLTFAEGRCRSHKLRLTFSDPNDLEIEDYNDVVERILQLLELVRPIHVEFDKVSFDGPKAVASWEEPVVVDNTAASTWTAAVTAAKTASTTWFANVNASLEG